MEYFLLSSSRINVFQTWTPSSITVVNDSATTFGCVKPDNTLRRACRRVVLHRRTQACWIVLVLLSTAMGAAVQPRYDMGDVTYKVLFALQVVCLAFFWLRMLAEVVASGLVEGQHAFLRSVWNWVEVAVNVFGLLQVIPPTSHIRWMRAVAAARPLRFFVFARWWRPLLVALARGFPYMLDVSAMVVLCLFALGLSGVFSVGAELYQRCYITGIDPLAVEPYADLPLPFLLRNVTNACGAGFTCPTITKDVTVECLANRADHRDHFFTYQNIGTALLLTLKVATYDMWFENLEDVMNVKGPAAAFYPVIVVLVALFLTVMAMTVVYNAYAHLDSWFMLSGVTLQATGERQRRECGVQTAAPLRQHARSLQPQQPPLLPYTASRSARLLGRSQSVDEHAMEENEASARNPFAGSGPVFTAYSAMQGTATTEGRYTRDFLHSIRARGFWAALRGLEQTTTAATGTEPRVRWAATAVDSIPMVVVMVILSVGNVVLLATVSVSVTEKTARTVRQTSSAMALFFVVPILLKLVGFGLAQTLKDVWNYADVLGIASGVLELAAGSVFHIRVLGILRTLRYLHVGKYIFSFQQYHYELQRLVSLVLLWSAVLVLYAILGMQLFGNAYVAGPSAYVRNGDFTTFWAALLACLRACTGDVWTRYLFAVSESTSVATGALFFVSLQLCAVALFFSLGHSILFRGFRDAARDEDMLRFEDHPPLLLLPPIKESRATTSSSGVAAHGPAAEKWAPQWRQQRRWRHHAKLLGVTVQKTLYVRTDAFFLLSPTNRLRVVLLRVFGSLAYCVVSWLLVLAGSVALLFEQQHHDWSVEQGLRLANIILFVVFWVEMVAKWAAYGVFAPGRCRIEDEECGNVETMPAYFREPLNWLDFAANCLSLAAIAYPPLRVGRVLRLVRLGTMQERPNSTFCTVVASLRHVVKTVPLIFFLYIGFAVAGMQVFANGLYSCSDPTVMTQADCYGTFNATVLTYTGSAVELRDREWQRRAFHYDAFGPALLSVFAMTTVNHYGTFMDEAMSIRGAGEALSYNHAGYYVIFFIFALLMIRCYALRCIAAVLAAKLRRFMTDSMGTALLTPQQTRFAVSLPSVVYMCYLSCSFAPLSTRLSRWCHRVLTGCPLNGLDPLFSVVLNVVLLVVCAFVAATHAYEPPWQARMLLAVDCVAVAACGAELVLHVLAYGTQYLLRPSLMLDMVFFALMVVGVASPTLAFFRVAVFFKLLKTSNIAMQLLPFVWHANLLVSALAVYVFVLVTYAVVGTLVFGDIAPHGLYLTRQRNFHTVFGSLLVLFDCSTFDQWHLVMHACFDGARCHSNPAAACGNTSAAVVFFVSFVIVVNLVAVQLVFAAMVNAFTVPLYVDVIQPFLEVRRVWQQYAGAGALHCSFAVFLRLLPHLPASLTDGATHERASESDMIAFLSSLRLPLDDQLQLSYVGLLRGLAYRKYKLDPDYGTVDARKARAPAALTAGEYYGQLVRKRYCDEISRLAQTKVEAVRLCDDEAAPLSTTAMEGVSDPDTFRLHSDDYAVPRGALPIPSSNVFLYTFPGEMNETSVSAKPRSTS